MTKQSNPNRRSWWVRIGQYLYAAVVAFIFGALVSKIGGKPWIPIVGFAVTLIIVLIPDWFFYCKYKPKQGGTHRLDADGETMRLQNELFEE